MELKAVRGFKDILPGETEHWQMIEQRVREVFRAFGFRELRLPILEKTEVFARSIGENTDIVEKEMYTFQDRNGDSLTLRPEATASLMRAVVEHKLYGKSPQLKLFTMGPMFRHERPQKGRLRQFHQINTEVLGSASPLADGEVIWVAWEILNKLGAGNLRLEVNSLGCEVCRPKHREDLRIYLENVVENLCEDCRRRSLTNPLRVFDCKSEKCKKIMQRAPLIKHSLCLACTEHMGRVIDFLESVGIPFVINPYLVRGLDYYVKTTFEIISPDLGAQSTVAAGGRYDGLVKAMGGPAVPGVGMAVGVERLRLLLEQEPVQKSLDLFVAALGEEARAKALEWIRQWRNSGLAVEMSYEDKSLKAQLKQANRSGASWAVIAGENELESGELILRNMKTSEQNRLALAAAVVSVEKIIEETP